MGANHTGCGAAAHCAAFRICLGHLDQVRDGRVLEIEIEAGRERPRPAATLPRGRIAQACRFPWMLRPRFGAIGRRGPMRGGHGTLPHVARPQPRERTALPRRASHYKVASTVVSLPVTAMSAACGSTIGWPLISRW